MGYQRFLMETLAKIKFKSFDKSARDIERAFDKNWDGIYQHLAKSKFWKNKIRLDLDKNAVTDYEFYKQVFDNDMNNGKNSFSDENILLWALSGGTSGPPKYFPITMTYQKQFQQTTPPFLHHVLSKYKSFINLPVLYLASTNPTEKTKHGIDIGYISNYNYRNIPGFLKSKYVLPNEVLRDGKTFEKFGHLYTLASDLSAIISVTPLSLQQFYNRIIGDYDGCLEQLENPSLDPGLPDLKISRERLSYLKSLKDINFKKLWPSLEFVCCWKTSTCAFQLKAIEAELDGIDIIDATYSATEGWINIPFADPNINGGAYHPEAVLIEFSLPNDPDNLLKPWELKQGKEYEIYITNKMGLIRYRLYDVVICTGFHRKSPILEFSHKSGQQISLGMCVIAENELLEILEKEKIELDDFFFCPNEAANALAIYIPKSANNLSVEVLDKALKDSNINYQKYRDSGQIQGIQIVREDNAFWSREKHAQTKPKFLYQMRPW